MIQTFLFGELIKSVRPNRNPCRAKIIQTDPCATSKKQKTLVMSPMHVKFTEDRLLGLDNAPRLVIKCFGLFC